MFWPIEEAYSEVGSGMAFRYDGYKAEDYFRCNGYKAKDHFRYHGDIMSSTRVKAGALTQLFQK